MRSSLLIVAAALCVSADARLDRPALRVHHAKKSNGSAQPTDTALMRLRGGEVAAPTTETSLIGMIVAQVAMEVAKSTTHPAKFFGFMGACCNWFLGLSAVYDAARNGPEVIALPMTLAMLAYSLLFSRWAGWDVSPKNFILSGSHMFNVVAQCNQLRRCLEYKLETDPAAKAEITALAKKAAGVIAGVVAFVMAAPTLKAMMPEGSYLASSGGPFTIHPWPPVTKLFLSAASLTDLHRPTSKISLTQYAPRTPSFSCALLFSHLTLYPSPFLPAQVRRVDLNRLHLLVLWPLRHPHQLPSHSRQYTTIRIVGVASRAQGWRLPGVKRKKKRRDERAIRCGYAATYFI